MTDELERILALVAEGVVSPEEADRLIEALPREQRARPAEERPERDTRRGESESESGQGRGLRIEVRENGRRVVNLRVPAGLATRLVPGLSESHMERIRAAMLAGSSGPILEVVDENGDGVLITTE